MKFSKKIIRINEQLPAFNSKKIVFTNGCFDLLHPGHIQYLFKAKQLGEVLVVGLNSDSSIKKIKGHQRPINNFEFRSEMLSYFNFIDYVIEFIDETPINLIRSISPVILVKGGDYLKKEVIGADYIKSIGGKIVFIDFLDGFSTSKLISDIQKIK